MMIREGFQEEPLSNFLSIISIKNEAPRQRGEASRKGDIVHIVPLDPAYKAGLAGHVPVKQIVRPSI
jgi:hypothetical protein